MNKILSIGSIIALSEKKFCIVGFSSIEKDNETICGYYVVSYPVGYIDLEHLLFIPANATFEVLDYGYVNPEVEAYSTIVKKAFECANKYTKKDIEASLNTIKNMFVTEEQE